MDWDRRNTLSTTTRNVGAPGPPACSAAMSSPSVRPWTSFIANSTLPSSDPSGGECPTPSRRHPTRLSCGPAGCPLGDARVGWGRAGPLVDGAPAGPAPAADGSVPCGPAVLRAQGPDLWLERAGREPYRFPVQPTAPVACDPSARLLALARGEEVDHQLDVTDGVAGSGADPDARALSPGADRVTSRNAPTVLDTDLREGHGWGWIARYCTLEAQVAAALRGPMNLDPSRDDGIPPVLPWSAGSEQHNVYSVIAHDAFNLGLYPVGQQRDHRLRTVEGRSVVYELRCHRHATMRAWILVVPNRWWARVEPDGSYELAGVAPGPHTVVAWSEAGRGEATVTVEPGATTTFSWSLQTGSPTGSPNLRPPR